MLNKATIQAFLARNLEGYDYLKSYPDKTLDETLRSFDYDSKGLWRHQKAATALMLASDRFMFHIDMGGGKTALCLRFLEHKKKQGEKLRTIVFVPYITSIDAWVTECKKHTFGLICCPLMGTVQENINSLHNSNADFFVICYQSAVALACLKDGDGWALSNELLLHFKDFDCMILDEVHRVKNKNSLTFSLAVHLARQCKYVYGLTGTPFGKDLQDLWAQFYLIDFGETLGRTISFYREVFFTCRKRHFGKRTVFEYNFKKRLMPVLQRTIKNCSIRYALSEFSKLEEPVRQQITLQLPDSVKGYVDKAKANLREALRGKDPNRYQLVESSYLQLRQLSSGFMTAKGEDDERVQFLVGSSPKLEYLKSLMEDIPPESQIVVFHHFVYTSFLISGMLTKLGIPHGRIWSGQRNPLGELERFRSKEDRVLVLNCKSGATSLNLQNANYIIFFEQPDNPIDRQQAERRVWRPGQEQRVILYDLFVEETLDQRMYESNAEGRALLHQLLDSNGGI